MIGHPMSQHSVPITGNEKGVSSQSISEPDKVTTQTMGSKQWWSGFQFNLSIIHLGTTFIIFENIPDRFFFVNPLEQQKGKSLASKRFWFHCV